MRTYFACSAFCRAFAFSSVYLHFIVFLPKPRTVLFPSVLHFALCVRIRYMDISDCQMSGVGLGITKWGQDYKALTVLYWSLPLYFVKRGTSSAEALEVMSKNRTAVYPLPSMSRPPTTCPVCPSFLLYSFAESFYAVFVYLLSISLVSLHIFCCSHSFAYFCLSSIPFFSLDLSVHMVIKKLFCFCFFKRNVLGIKRLVPL